MKWALHAVLVSAFAGCQSGNQDPAPAPATGDTKIIQLPKAQLSDAYKADISNLCDAVRLSGAHDKPPDERWTHVAMWLGPNTKTNEGRDFLVAIQPLRGEAKALALDTEAKRVGLAKCVLADEWRAAAAKQ
jgi:hypothetical protein